MSKTNLQPKLVSPYGFHSPFSSLVFQRSDQLDYGETAYIYGPRYHRDSLSGFYKNVKSLSGVIDNAEDKWFIFYVEDCYDPGMYAISANSFQDAYDWFITACEHLVKIDEEDLKDYNVGDGDDGKLDCSFNDNGTPVDTELVQGFEVKIVEARR